MLSRHAASPDDLCLLDGDASEMGNSGCCSAMSAMVVQGQDALGAFGRGLRRRSLSLIVLKDSPLVLDTW